MDIFVVSQQFDSWNVYQLGESSCNLTHGFDDENEAIISALDAASQNQPSRVIRISLSGDTQIIAKFGEDKAYN